MNVFDQEQEFLESPPTEAMQLAQVAKVEQPKQQIGPYVLREQVGEGGIGVVFVTESRRYG